MKTRSSWTPAYKIPALRQLHPRVGRHRCSRTRPDAPFGDALDEAIADADFRFDGLGLEGGERYAEQSRCTGTRIEPLEVAPHDGALSVGDLKGLSENGSHLVGTLTLRNLCRSMTGEVPTLDRRMRVKRHRARGQRQAGHDEYQ